jgi:hypothetical protein
MHAFRLAAAASAALLMLSAPAAGQPARSAPPTLGGPHDFDFEFGDWTCHLKRLVHPLSGASEWVEYDGPSIVRKVWDGKANLGEIELTGPAGHIEGLSLRVYNPATHQWSVTYANSGFGMGGPPLVGGFRGGRGEFYAADTLNDRAIFVRFIFSDITPATFRLEQAFSDDGGKTWEANWIATFRRTT